MRLVTPALLCALASKDSWCHCHCQLFTHLPTVQMYRDVITNVSVLIYWFPPPRPRIPCNREELVEFLQMLYLLFPPKQWESFSSIDPSFALLPNALSLSALLLLLLSMQSSCQLVTPSFSLLQSYAPSPLPSLLSFPHSQACERSRRFHLNVGSTKMA